MTSAAELRDSSPPGLGKGAAVTGAATGIGEGIAARLLRDGWRVALIDADPKVITTTSRLIVALGLPEEAALSVVADVSVPEQIDAAIAEAAQSFSSLELAVANAGVGGVGTDLIDMTPEQFDRIMSVDLRGVFLTCRAAGRVMRGAGRGSIVTISSIFGWEPSPGAGAYSAAKAGVIALTLALAGELAPSGVRVNSIAPGNIETSSLLDGIRRRATYEGVAYEDEYERIVRSVPLARLGTPADIGAAVAYLASNDAAYITGHTLGVTGGLVRR